MIKSTPDELFIQKAIIAGRCTKKNVSMKDIGTPDPKFQARVKHLDPDHCARLEWMISETGDELAPVVLFYDIKNHKYYLADGHHRHHVYQKLNWTEIPAYVIESEEAEREAIEYACMCNRQLCLGRNKKDIEKAINMLFDVPGWINRSTAWISDHVGIGAGSIKRYRSKYCNNKGIAVPDKLIDRTGSEYVLPVSNGVGMGNLAGKKGSGFHVNVDGVSVSLGTKEMEAWRKARDIKIKLDNDRRMINDNHVLSSYFMKNGLYLEYVADNANLRIKAYSCCDIIFSTCDIDDELSSIFDAIGRVVITKRMVADRSHMVILIRHIPGTIKKIVETAKKLDIEFMNLDQLINRLKKESKIRTG